MSEQGKTWRWWSAPPSWEIMNDREALLKYELSLIEKAGYEEAESIISELRQIEAMKPPKPIYIESMLLSAEQVKNIIGGLDDE